MTADVGMSETNRHGMSAPLYRYTGPRRTGQIANPRDDVAAIEHLIREAPADYPGLPGMHARRDELLEQVRAAASELTPTEETS